MSKQATAIAEAAPPANVSTRELGAMFTEAKAAPSTSEDNPADTPPPAPLEGELTDADPVEEITPTPDNDDPVDPSAAVDPTEVDAGPEPEPAPDADLEPAETDESTAPRALDADVLAAIEEAGLSGSQAKLVKRIHKAVDQRKAAEARIAQLESQVADQGAPDIPMTSRGTDAVAVHPDVQAITAEIGNQQQLQKTLQQHLDGEVENVGQFKLGDGREFTLTAEQLEQHLEQSREYLDQLKTEKVVTVREARKDLRDQAQAYEAEVAKHYPHMADKQSPEYQEAQNWLSALPEMQRLPGWRLALADMMAGYRARTAAANASDGEVKVRTRPAAPARQPTPQVAKAPVAPTRQTPNDTVKAAQDRTRKSGRTSDLAAEFSAKRQARRQAA